MTAQVRDLPAPDIAEPTANVIPFPLYDRLYRIWEESDGPDTFPDRTE